MTDTPCRVLRRLPFVPALSNKTYSTKSFWYEIIQTFVARIFYHKYTLHKKCPYSEYFWSVFFLIRTEYTPHSIQMRKIRSRKNPNTHTFDAVTSVLNILEPISDWDFLPPDKQLCEWSRTFSIERTTIFFSLFV